MNTDQEAEKLNPNKQPLRLNEQLWFIAFLAEKGFKAFSSEIFTRERAKIEVKGAKLRADPGTGDKTWNADLQGAKHSTIKMIVEQILNMRPFFTDAQIAKERASKESLERALTGICTTIMEGSDTHSVVQLRRFLWSLYNGHHLVNLWRMTCVLDSTRASWVSEVFAGAFVGVLKEDDIKRALVVAGEMRRWDEVRLSGETQRRIEDLIQQIETMVRTIPPSRAHVELNTARERLWAVQQALHRATETPTEEGSDR